MDQDRRCSATMSYATTVQFVSSMCMNIGDNFYGNPYEQYQGAPLDEAETKKRRKAENKATLLLQNLIGSEQCDVYRKCHRIIIKPNKWFWVIGNISRSYSKDDPFISKPDVIRIDNAKKLHVTYFCVSQRNGGPTPYTDKVASFAVHLMDDEKAFVKTINRIREGTLKKVPECAVWE